VGEQWWDGWIGALLAATLTVGATVWWDARVRRRQRLEDAVVRLYEAATDLGVETARLKHGIGSPEELAAAHRAMGSAHLLAQGLALRRVLLVSAKVAAPARWGLARTIGWLSDRWNQTSLAQDEQGQPKRPDEIVKACQGVSVACLVWLSRPMSYWPGRQRGPEYIEATGYSGE
jgi:hypothetical protein